MREGVNSKLKRKISKPLSENNNQEIITKRGDGCWNLEPGIWNFSRWF
jgi:hypothetical protein